MFDWDGWVSLPQSWTSSDEWRRLCQHGGSLKTGNSSRFAACIADITNSIEP